MKKIIIGCLVGLGLVSASVDRSLVVHLGSQHYNKHDSAGTKYSNTNFGLGIQWEQDRKQVAIGLVSNSYSKASVYGRLSLNVLDLKKYGKVYVDGVLATGYPTCSGKGIRVMGGMSYEYKGFRLYATPDYKKQGFAHLTYSMPF